MKKFYILLIIAILAMNVANAQQSDKSLAQNKRELKGIVHKQYSALKNNEKLQTPKSMVWQWDTIIGYDANNNLAYRYTQKFNSNGNLINSTTEQWQNNAWVNYERYTYTFNANSNMLTGLYEEWQNNAWLNIYIDVYTYNTNGYMLTHLYKEWQNNAWADLALTTNTYDTNNNMMSELYSEWQNNTWVNLN